MAKRTVEVLVYDLHGSAAAETARLGWNREWREVESVQAERWTHPNAFDAADDITDCTRLSRVVQRGSTAPSARILSTYPSIV
jgi:hypothetical protein